MNILVIDGQGGRIGSMLCAEIRSALPTAEIIAVGTNSVATLAMQKAGADKAATGENAVVVACRNADIIAGPVGIVVANALIGEVTAKMAAAVGSSSAKKILIPVNMCDTFVVGVNDTAVSSRVSMAVLRIMNEIR